MTHQQSRMFLDIILKVENMEVKTNENKPLASTSLSEQGFRFSPKKKPF